ncbi:MAG TPA: hypothetical protein VFB54_10330 [Burkholderiales bacterium]|nr:hypothetical protein [Burkholderiales bacterium]
MAIWREPAVRNIASLIALGGSFGAFIAHALFPAASALLFGGVIGAYGGFLAAAMLAAGSKDWPELGD